MKGRFRGQSEHMLDAKGRIIFPGRYRDVLEQNGAPILMVVPWGTCLRAYPIDEWETFEDKLMENINSPRVEKFVRQCAGRAVECPIDKQGRILLPANLRAAVGLEKEIILSGMLRWVEIWDKATAEKVNEEVGESFEDIKNATLAQIGNY